MVKGPNMDSYGLDCGLRGRRRALLRLLWLSEKNDRAVDALRTKDWVPFVYLVKALHTVVSCAKFCSSMGQWVPHVRIVAAKSGAHGIEGVPLVSSGFSSREKTSSGLSQNCMSDCKHRIQERHEDFQSS
jgi:hypothetical protein